MIDSNDSPSTKVRLSKLMAERGICSRREADEYIAQGLVFVNGERINILGLKVEPDVEIELAGKAQQKQNDLVTIILNKPVGYVSAQPEKGYEPAIRLITAETQFKMFPNETSLQFGDLKGIAVVGRLDIDSQGLLIFTQDGRLARKIIGENSPIEKEYLVRYQGELTKEKINSLRFGLELDGKPLRKAKVEELNKDQLKIILVEGRKRQIRRMLELVGLRVTGLKRVRVGKLKLSDLPEGQWRFLHADEEI